MWSLRYIFWVVPSFLLAGCASPTLMYRPEVLRTETATPRPMTMLYDPPAVAQANAYYDYYAPAASYSYGNPYARRPARSVTGYYDGAEVIQYRLDYYDRQGGGHGYHRGYRGRHGHHGNHSRIRRTFRYTLYGRQLR